MTGIDIDNIITIRLTFFINRRDGETGRHAGFKIQWPRGRAGSIPALGTIFELDFLISNGLRYLLKGRHHQPSLFFW